MSHILQWTRVIGIAVMFLLVFSQAVFADEEGNTTITINEENTTVTVTESPADNNDNSQIKETQGADGTNEYRVRQTQTTEDGQTVTVETTITIPPEVTPTPTPTPPPNTDKPTVNTQSGSTGKSAGNSSKKTKVVSASERPRKN